MNLEKYIGLPYQENGRTWQGVDCWGLARLYYKEELNIDLPDYSSLYTGSWDSNLSDIIDQQKEGWHKVTSPIKNDLCLFNIYGEPVHIGIYIGENKFLHARDGHDSVIESLGSLQWSKRLEGTYRYVPGQPVQITGAPHPLKLNAITEWATAGSTIQEIVDQLQIKYNIGRYLQTRLVVLIDGIAVPRDSWATTVIKQGQQLTYRVLAQGRNASRLILTIIVIAIAFAVGDYVDGLNLAASIGKTGALVVKSVAMAATMQAGMALVNRIAPVRLPDPSKDPGQPNQLNLFNGSSNQANRLGAIPVVLGKIRYTGLLGATPYIETHTSTNVLNLLIIWGFGPLEIDPKSINVGAVGLESAFYDDTTEKVELPRTLYGSKSETQADIDRFNELYPSDVEQIFKNVELLNNPTAGNPWQEVQFIQEGTRVDLTFSFPEGMRTIKNRGDGAGNVSEASCSIEIQVAEVGQSFNNTPAINPGNGSISETAYSSTLTCSNVTYSSSGGYDSTTIPIYRWYDICFGPGGKIVEFAGAGTDNPDADPSPQLVELYRTGSYSSLLGINQSYTRFPKIPAGYTPIYRLCLQSGVGLLPNRTVNYLQGQQGYFGFILVTDNETVPGMDEALTPVPTGNVKVTISGGSYYPDTAPLSGQQVVTTKFVTSPSSVPGTYKPSADKYWSKFLQDNAIWVTGATQIDKTVSVTLDKSGVYDFEASGDDDFKITFNGEVLFDVKAGYKSTSTRGEYYRAGTYNLRIECSNSGSGAAGVAVKITYSANSGLNIPKSTHTIFTIGSGAFSKRKDPFNYTYSIPDIPRARYKVQVRRVDVEPPEVENPEYTILNSVAFSNAISFDNKLPTVNLPRGRIAKTAIRVQSTGKANGQVDGINALVQTQAYDWDRANSEWVFRSTNNPASLFLYVLMHPANAYRIADMEQPNLYQQVSSKVDLNTIIEWHNFCNPATPTANNPKLTFNTVLTNTQSVMDTLRDICAAGKASPIFVDGKWSVVIDKPRTVTVQHFTPHNSWGFEATKTLPRLPHAFRVTIPDEENAYQSKELYAYNYGYSMYGTEPGKKAAEIFEELSLPGVTNTAQALHLAQWHLAQLKLRPETYTINTDFEYLVCNRGDLVKVSHDVPLWGTGSGRIKSISGTTIVLTEQLALAAASNYIIRIRTNSGSSVTLNVASIAQAGYYDTITVTTAVPNTVEADNLFMLGANQQETQNLVVLSIEPSSNVSARITLTDYSPEIYTADLANDLLVFNPNITKPTTGIVENTITGIPIVNSITSTRETSQQISTGIYQTTALLNFSNPGDLSKNAERVQFEMVRGDESFNPTNPAAFYLASKESGNITFTGLETGITYKVRARYTNNVGNVFGAWSPIKFFVAGASGLTPSEPTLEMDLDNTYIVAKVPQTYLLLADFQTFEYRLYKDTGTEDFWDLEPNTTNNIKVIRSTAEGRFNLLDLPTPRLSEAGISYRVACRAVNRNNEYSAQSALGTIVIKTIT